MNAAVTRPPAPASGALRCAALLAALSMLPVAASAQDAPPPENVHRVGPMSISPTVTLQNFGIDSNVYNSTQPVSDLTFTLVPAVAATTRLRRFGLTLRSATDLVYFARQTSERSVNQALSGSGRVDLGRLALTVAGAYLNTRQRPTEEIDARSRRVGRTGEAGVEVFLTRKVTGGVRAGHARTEFDADAVFDDTFLARELDRTATSVAASLRYAATRLTAVSVSGTATRTEFLRASDRDADTREILVGINLHPRALISGDVSVGYQRFRPRSPGLPELRGAVGVASISYRLSASTRLGVSGGRNVDYSYFEDLPYYVREGLGATVQRHLTGRWDLQFEASRFMHRYRRRTAVEADVYAGSDRLWQLGIVVGHEVSPASRITVGLTYVNRQSAFPGRSYDNLRLGSALSYAF